MSDWSDMGPSVINNIVSKDMDGTPFCVLEILVYCEVEHKSKKYSRSSQEVPDVMAIEKVQEDTFNIKAPVMDKNIY